MTEDRLAAALAVYRAQPVDVDDNPASWAALDVLLGACGELLAERRVVLASEPTEGDLDAASLLAAMEAAWPKHREGSFSSPSTGNDVSWDVLDPALPSLPLAEAIAARLRESATPEKK